MFRLPIDETGSLLYFPADDIPGLHIAFRVDEPTFDAVVDRLRARGLTFGNDPEDQTNMQVSDFLGGHGRVFFLDPNGHLFRSDRIVWFPFLEQFAFGPQLFSDVYGSRVPAAKDRSLGRETQSRSGT